MKIFLILAVIVLLSCTFFFFNKKNAPKISVLNYGPFALKTEVSYNKRINGDLKWVTETKVAYSVWYKNKLVTYPSETQGNTGYSHLWRVYILEGAPKPTLIAGSQSLFMINEDNGKLAVTPLDTQDSDFASLQFLDETLSQPGKLMNVYMANQPDTIETLRGGDYLLVSQRMLIHVPDLKLHPFTNIDENIDGYHFIKVGGVQNFSPDKRSLVFMSGKYDDNNKYHYAMIEYSPSLQKANIVPYGRTETRSVDLNYENREWFNTYFEWIKKPDDDYHLQLKKYEALPPWLGSFADQGVVYQLTPVKNDLQQVFVNFILKELDLKQEDVHPGKQYSSNTMVVYYKNFKFNVWLRPEDQIVVLMMDDNYIPEAAEGIKIIHQLGDHFNKELKTGKYQEYFTRLKD